MELCDKSMAFRSLCVIRKQLQRTVPSSFPLPSLTHHTINYSIDSTSSCHVVSDITKASHWPCSSFPASVGSRAANVLGLDFVFSDCLDIVNASPLWQQQGVHGILVPINQYLPCRFQRVPSIRLIACMCTLCVGCPQMCFLSARHKGDPRRGHFAWQHILKAEERRLCFSCCCYYYYCFMGSSDKEMLCSTNASHHQSSVSCHFEMAEVALEHDAVIVTGLDAGACILREIDMVVFSPRTYAVIAAALSL